MQPLVGSSWLHEYNDHIINDVLHQVRTLSLHKNFGIEKISTIADRLFELEEVWREKSNNIRSLTRFMPLHTMYRETQEANSSTEGELHQENASLAAPDPSTSSMSAKASQTSRNVLTFSDFIPVMPFIVVNECRCMQKMNQNHIRSHTGAPTNFERKGVRKKIPRISSTKASSDVSMEALMQDALTSSENPVEELGEEGRETNQNESNSDCAPVYDATNAEAEIGGEHTEIPSHPSPDLCFTKIDETTPIDFDTPVDATLSMFVDQAGIQYWSSPDSDVNKLTTKEVMDDLSGEAPYWSSRVRSSSTLASTTMTTHRHNPLANAIHSVLVGKMKNVPLGSFQVGPAVLRITQGRYRSAGEQQGDGGGDAVSRTVQPVQTCCGDYYLKRMELHLVSMG